MTLYWYDSFKKTNQSGFGNPDNPPAGTYSLVRGNQTLSIASNEGVMTYVNTTTAGVVQAGSQQIGDCEILCRVSQGGSTTDLVGVVTKFIDSNNWYCFVIGDTAGQFQLIKDVANTFTVKQSFAFTTTVGSFYWIRARVQGTHFLGKIWADGSAEPNTWGIDTTDSSLTANGTFGLTCAPQSGNNVKVDSFYVIDYLNSEALTISDSFSGQVTSSRTEALSISDSQAATSTAAPVEALSISDSQAVTSAASLIEALSLVDGSTVASSYAATEALTIADLSSVLAGPLLVEVLTLASQNGASQASSWVEGLAASSQGGNAGGANMSETLILADAFGGGISASALDALAVADPFRADLAASWVEGLAITDSFTGVSAPGTAPAAPPRNATVVVLSGQATVLVPTGRATVEVLTGQGTVIVK